MSFSFHTLLLAICLKDALALRVIKETSMSASDREAGAVAAAKRQRDSKWCPRSPFIEPSPEDLLFQSESCSDQHVIGKQELNENPCPNVYGRWFNNSENKKFFYVEIPKAASSTVKLMLDGSQSGAESSSWFDTTFTPFRNTDAENIPAFAFIRHPIPRFISGYGTIVNRMHAKTQKDCVDPELHFLFDTPEPQRFNMFVDLFVKHGAGILKLYHCAELDPTKKVSPCVMHHVMSQTWFLNLWPGPVDVYHVETMAADMATISQNTKITFRVPPILNRNEGNLNRGLIMAQHDSLAKLHLYFKKDMERFGYQPYPGY